ncbi:MAG: RNA polymerase sigma factor [Limisphaerales bacterium]
MNDDLTLLREFAADHSEAAFAALVNRHVNLVYSVALRRVRDPHLAEEITQVVFIILARQAGALGDNTILPGWLCRTACYASADALRKQQRRQQREHEAQIESIVNEPESEAWQQIAPVLEAAMAQLGRKDHDALALRFFENKSFAEVAAALRTSEGAAKMRVSRALDKLRVRLVKRGVTLTATVLAGAVAANSVQAAPAGLAVKLTAVAAKGAATTTSITTILKGTLKIMAWTKMKTAVVIGVGILLAEGTTTVLLKEHAAPKQEGVASNQLRIQSPVQSPVAEPAIRAWQQGNKAEAINQFLEADWSNRPLFDSNSALSLTEGQFAALSNADRQTKSTEMLSKLDMLKQLAAAVSPAGLDAAAKGDAVQARKCFTALNQCGAALSSPDCLQIVQMVGKALNKLSDADLAKVGQ